MHEGGVSAKNNKVIDHVDAGDDSSCSACRRVFRASLALLRLGSR
jgi:hypothetical protein